MEEGAHLSAVCCGCSVGSCLSVSKPQVCDFQCFYRPACEPQSDQAVRLSEIMLVPNYTHWLETKHMGTKSVDDTP